MQCHMGSNIILIPWSWPYKTYPCVEDILSGSLILLSLDTSFPIMLFSITLTIFCSNHLYYSIFVSLIVFEGSVSAGQLLNLAHSLVKRIDIPTDVLCDSPAHWASRACVTGLPDREWEDTCISDDGDIHWRTGECPDDTMCQNTLTQDSTDDVPVETISCIQCPQQNRLVAPDEQSGVFAASDTSTAGPSWHTVTVTVETNLVDATVSGLVEGMY